MTITCMECGQRNFTFDPNDLEHVKVITFICDSCGKTTAVCERDGGGVTVALEDRTKWTKPA